MAESLQPNGGFESIQPWGSPYETSADVRRRFKVYDFAVNKRDIQKEALRFGESHLGLTGEETVVEMGCSDGTDLINLRTKRKYQGLLIGVDINRNLFTKGISTIEQKGLQSVDFVVGKAEDLGFIKDNSVDIVLGWNMLYEVKPPEKALAEARRMLRRDGLFIASTWGEDNISSHRTIERSIAAIWGFDPPEMRSRRFSTRVAEQKLPEFFSIVQRFRKTSPIHIPPEFKDVYKDSLDTRKNDFKDKEGKIPSATVWKQIRERIIDPFIDNEIKHIGYVQDWMDKWVYVCQNNLD